MATSLFLEEPDTLLLERPNEELLLELPTVVEATASLAGGGTLAATATIVYQAVALLSGGGTLAATAAVVREATAILDGGGVLAVSSGVTPQAAVLLDGGGVLAATASVIIVVGSGIGRNRVTFHNDQRVTFRSDS